MSLPEAIAPKKKRKQNPDTASKKRAPGRPSRKNRAGTATDLISRMDVFSTAISPALTLG
jgi:hypothetical protein